MIPLRNAALAALPFKLFKGDPLNESAAMLVAWYRSLQSLRDNGNADAVAFFRSFPQFISIAIPNGGKGLVRDPSQVIGVGEHRGGWRVAVEALAKYQWPVQVDDFAEHSFVYYTQPPTYVEPWVGIFHHPPNMPKFAEDRQKPQFWMQRPQFVESAKQLVAAFALSEYLAEWLRPRLSCPVFAVKHPAELDVPTWQATAGAIRLVQVGYYLRNVAAIFQVPPSTEYTREKLQPTDRAWVDDWAGKVHQFWANGGSRPNYPGVANLATVGRAEYDSILASAVVLTEVFDASANNVVVECAARGTPLVVNRHPAVVEYLGRNYPLFFDRIEDVPGLLTRERIAAASEYMLHTMPRRYLSPEAFAVDIYKTVATIAARR